MNRSPEQLKRWANEHLVYEALMLSHAVWKVADESLSDQDRNAFIESFAIHVRCLRDFLWGHRRPNQPEDAFAFDFCEPGAWEEARPAIPAALQAIEGERQRIGREIVHLTYHRLDIKAETKPWEMSELLRVIAEALKRFSEVAKPERLADTTRKRLASVSQSRKADAKSPIATATTTQADRRGTISFAGYSADDIGGAGGG